jgi:hypothetical protein
MLLQLLVYKWAEENLEFHFSPKIWRAFAVNMMVNVMKNENICAGFKL